MTLLSVSRLCCRYQVVNDKRSELLREMCGIEVLAQNVHTHCVFVHVCACAFSGGKDSIFKDVNTFGTRLLFKQRNHHTNAHTLNDQIFMGTTD